MARHLPDQNGGAFGMLLLAVPVVAGMVTAVAPGGRAESTEGRAGSCSACGYVMYLAQAFMTSRRCSRRSERR